MVRPGGESIKYCNKFYMVNMQFLIPLPCIVAINNGTAVLLYYHSFVSSVLKYADYVMVVNSDEKKGGFNYILGYYQVCGTKRITINLDTQFCVLSV